MHTQDPYSSKRRSRTPPLNPDPEKHRRRSRSPHSRHHHHHHSSSEKQAAQLPLPFQASPLRRHDFEKYEPMFGLYLDIQKQLALEDLAEEEVKGRWKSFMGKW